MANTTIPVELSSTPGIVDNSNATAITIDSSENVGIGTGSPFANQILNTSWSAGAPYGTVLAVTGNNTNDANWGHLLITDSTTTTGSGGTLRFGTGSTSGDINPFAGIDSYSEGSNYGGLKFLTRPSGGIATERLRIDSSGRVTMPYQPAFLVTPSSQQSDLSGSTTVAFGTEIFDQGSNFASNTFTAPVTGKYQFNLSLYIVNFDVSATYVSFYIEASNRNVEIVNSGSVFGATDPTYSSIAMGCLLDMDANDTCYIQCIQSGGAAQMDIAIYSRFSGFLVC
jgi:hypothetical protein